MNASTKALVCVSMLIVGAIGLAAHAADVSMVTVREPGNVADTRYGSPGFGAVGYLYKIGKYDITTSQYCDFLNAVARTDTHELYSPFMANTSDPNVAGCNIQRIGQSGTYTYFIGNGLQADKDLWGNRPVNYVSWGDAARFCNWLTNGRPTSVPQNLSSTEDGSYFLNGARTDVELAAVTRRGNAQYVIPTEDEWYKAAYYSTSGYWEYPTRSNSAPSNVLDSEGTNNANYNTSSRTDVGKLLKSFSFYDTFDQGGNVWQWNEALLPNGQRGIRGGAYTSINVINLSASYRNSWMPSSESKDVGFRIAELLVGDLNADARADEDDMTLFKDCASGPSIPYAPGCESADLDRDGDVDSTDFAILQRHLGSEHIPPTITTADISDITSISASSGGQIIDQGSHLVTERGVCWSTNEHPTIADENLLDAKGGAGAFTSSLTDLIPNTTYYVRAYATTSQGTAYGAQKEFKSSALPTITTKSVTNIGETSAHSGGEISSQGTHPITLRGICWSTSPLPTKDLTTKTENGSGTSPFTSIMTGLTPGTLYYVRAYAINSVGTSYGQQETFTTVSPLTVDTAAVTNITGYTADTGGHVISDGGVAVNVRGVCWSTSELPTKDLPTRTENGSGTGTFISIIQGLTPDTTYYVRAYATNLLGTAYGQQRSFKTLKLPTVTTAAIGDITGVSATSGGNVTDDADLNVFERGICWNTAPLPTTNHFVAIDQNTGMGAFTSSMTDLIPGIRYYVRAYAVCELDTVYGQQFTFVSEQLTSNMVIIPAGQFLMGDPFNEGNANEFPRHTVDLNAYSIGKHEVTNQEYADALNWAMAQDDIRVLSGIVYKKNRSDQYCTTTSASADSQIIWNSAAGTFSVVEGRGNHPVVMVSWYGAVAYANWRSGMEGKSAFYNPATDAWAPYDWSYQGYRLPTEAEWEKAARGGMEGRRFSWGTDSIQHALANYYSYGSTTYGYDTSATLFYHPDFSDGMAPYTSPVGTFAANGYGLHDISGNVHEWCYDWYSNLYYGSSPASNPTGPASGTYRVLRGGSWNHDAFRSRCSYRLTGGSPSVRYYHFGFRLAINASPEE